jgi:hypothetical protein
LTASAFFPFYHYGPLNKNERIFIDTTVVPDPLQWVLDQFRRGRLEAMIERAGYVTVASTLDEDLIAAKLPEIEPKTQAMIRARLS